ncbi:hypothetical protein GOBAR_DD21195 [Gossypium barbadense]|nr:hypothetical protein GOBAR_DD21195 [Gossypium barbadense]
MGKTISCSVLLALISCFYLLFATALDTITPSKSIKDPDVIISQKGLFRLGFFSLVNSSNRYVGILYHQIPIQTVVWVANRNRPLKDSSGILTISDDGNLVVSNGKAEILWSTNVNNTAPNATTAQLLDSGNLISTDVKTGRKVELKSWKSIDDPSDGNFSLSLEPFNSPEGIIRKNNQLYYRTGPWNGNTFIGLIDKYAAYLEGCLKGFKPRNIEEWSRGNWSSGCSRTTLLQCQRDNNGSGASQGDDWFLEMKMMKVPAFPHLSSISNGQCKDQCMNMKNCSCVAYAYDDGIGCMLWSGDLIDVQKFSASGVDLYIRLPSSELDKEKSSKVIVITTVTAGIVVTTISALFLWCGMAKQRGTNKRHKQIKHKSYSENVRESLIGVKLQQLPLFNFEELATATNNFHPEKRLGQGGFGPVYKGTLDDGKEIAVKRLSKASGQGLEEFMNEVVVISKLQHRNLVRLLGCCVEAEEKIHL